MNKVTVNETIAVSAHPEKVWDYTQNWNHRQDWDKSILQAHYVQEGPLKSVQVKAKGGLSFDVQYKLSDRPHKTTLVMSNLNSKIVIGGGGSWRYNLQDGKTLWTQNNTLILPDNLMGKLLKPIVAMGLRRTTRLAMKRAKKILENGNV